MAAKSLIQLTSPIDGDTSGVPHEYKFVVVNPTTGELTEIKEEGADIYARRVGITDAIGTDDQFLGHSLLKQLNNPDSIYNAANSFEFIQSNASGRLDATFLQDFDFSLDSAGPSTGITGGTGSVLSGIKTLGTNDDEAVSLGYLNQQITNSQAGISLKDPVEVAVDANVNWSNPGTDTFDGITLSTGDRVLLQGQTNKVENGIYVFNTSSTAMDRAEDANGNPLE